MTQNIAVNKIRREENAVISWVSYGFNVSLRDHDPQGIGDRRIDHRAGNYGCHWRFWADHGENDAGRIGAGCAHRNHDCFCHFLFWTHAGSRPFRTDGHQTGEIGQGDPLKVVVATAFLTIMFALDGDGATTFMITISAMLPLYERLKMRRLVLSGTICLAAGVMNIIPWGGPTARAMTVLKLDSLVIFNPVIPAMVIGLVWVFGVAYYFGLQERKRLGVQNLDFEYKRELTEEEAAIRRPKLIWFNLILTLILVVALILNMMPLPVLFMIAYAIALIINFPNPKDQMARITAQGNNVVFVSSMIFAAGIFTGILAGTKMIGAMSQTLVSLIPTAFGPFLSLVVAVTSMPFSLIFTPDAYYFGVLPIISQTAAAFGIEPAQIGRAAILGQMTTGFPLSPLTASTFILVGMSGVELGDHQRFIFKWAFGSTIVMTIVAWVMGVI